MSGSRPPGATSPLTILRINAPCPWGRARRSDPPARRARPYSAASTAREGFSRGGLMRGEPLRQAAAGRRAARARDPVVEATERPLRVADADVAERLHLP